MYLRMFHMSLCRRREGNRHRNHELARAHLNFEFLFLHFHIAFFPSSRIAFLWILNSIFFMSLIHSRSRSLSKISYDPVFSLTWCLVSVLNIKNSRISSSLTDKNDAKEDLNSLQKMIFIVAKIKIKSH